MPTPRIHTRGVAILLVLFVIAAALPILSRITASSIRLHANANQAAATLRERWAVRSIQDCLHAQAEKVFGDSSGEQGTMSRSVRSIRGTITLGQRGYDYCLSNEQAKANVHAVLSGERPERAAARLRSIARGRIPAGPRDLISLEQLLTKPDTGDTAGTIWDEDGIGASLTLWSDGTIDVRAASPQAIEAVLGGSLTRKQVSDLKRAIDEVATSGETIEDLGPVLIQAGLPSDEVEAITPFLSLNANAVSVLVRWGRQGGVRRASFDARWSEPDPESDPESSETARLRADDSQAERAPDLPIDRNTQWRYAQTNDWQGRPGNEPANAPPVDSPDADAAEAERIERRRRLIW
ncbi:MAG: hypothetical protein AAGJ54_10700 [Planctomycetota bacterium]